MPPAIIMKTGLGMALKRQSIENMSREERQARLTEMNDNLRERGRPVHTEDPDAPLGHLMPIPGGHDAEQGAIRSFPHYHDPDQLYELVSDPGEQTNLAGDPRYAETLASMQTLMQSYLVRLPGAFPLQDTAETPDRPDATP